MDYAGCPVISVSFPAEFAADEMYSLVNMGNDGLSSLLLVVVDATYYNYWSASTGNYTSHE